jgi:hypothetical protein
MKCALCGYIETVPFHEHYTFCPDCSAIYTQMIVQEKNCDHIKDDTVVVEREPWYKSTREETIYIFEDACSVCKKKAIADGW